MDMTEWHFASPDWLWGLAVIPVMWMLFYLFFRPESSYKHLEKWIDSHLLPYLLVQGNRGKPSWVGRLLMWSVVWTCVILALAGPRWSFKEIEMLSKDQSLVIVLDLSESMNAADVKPSRLVRARQQIEDLINLAHGMKIGLIAFAADPHMIAPITEDKETIRHLLPSLGTDLIYIQGSRLSLALKMAADMLAAEPGNNKAIAIVTDGGFEDASATAEVKKLAGQGIAVHTVGVGTVQGAVLKDNQGAILKKNGTPVLSKLERDILQEISKAGRGSYIEQNYSALDVSAIVQGLEKKAETMQAGKSNRLWDERFLVFLLPALPFVLYWFRRGTVFSWMLLLLFPAFSLQASGMHEYFRNQEQIGAEAFEEGDYEKAAETFDDPYRRGVACYKAGDFAEAEKMFRLSSREEAACAAGYNLGNALARQQKFQEAVTAYEKVLKKWPDHQHARENLELIKKMLDQQKQEQQEQNSSDQDQDDKQEGNSGEDSKSQGQSSQDDSKDEDGGGDSETRKGDDQEEPDGEEKQPESPQKEPQDQQEPPSEPEEKSENDAAPGQEEQQQEGEGSQEEQQSQEEDAQEDRDADVWLNRISNDPKSFLKNKFYIESKKNGAKEGVAPW